jgi:hypothetical protein
VARQKPSRDRETEALIQEMSEMLEQADVDPAHLYAFSKTGRLVSEENKDALSPAEVKEWKSAIHEYSRHLERQQKGIETCFAIRARTKIPREERLASDAIAAMYACESGASSLAVEGILLNAWLTLAAKRMGITTTAAQRLREILSGDRAKWRPGRWAHRRAAARRRRCRGTYAGERASACRQGS